MENFGTALTLLVRCFYFEIGGAALAAAGAAWYASRFAGHQGKSFEFIDGLLFGAVGAGVGVLPVAVACASRGITDTRGSSLGHVLGSILFAFVEGAIVGGITWGLLYLRQRRGAGISTRRQN